MSGPLNYTTKVPVNRTVAEVTELLATHGASAVATMYRDGKPTGLTFSLATPGGNRVFQLPVLVDGVFRLLERRGARWDQAERVAWRQIKSWVEAQVAIIESGMATMEQVMLPYLQVEGGATLYEAYVEQGRKAIR